MGLWALGPVAVSQGWCCPLLPSQENIPRAGSWVLLVGRSSHSRATSVEKVPTLTSSRGGILLWKNQGCSLSAAQNKGYFQNMRIFQGRRLLGQLSPFLCSAHAPSLCHRAAPWLLLAHPRGDKSPAQHCQPWAHPVLCENRARVFAGPSAAPGRDQWHKDPFRKNSCQSKSTKSTELCFLCPDRSSLQPFASFMKSS